MERERPALVNSPAGGSAVAREPIQRGTAYEGFNVLYDGTGNRAATIATKITCHTTVETDLVQLVQRYGFKAHRGTPLGKLPELWPFDLIRRPLIEEAQRFIDQIATQGYSALTGPHAFKLWGPYTEKVGEPQNWTPEAGNHLIPKHEAREATKAWGYRGDEFDFSKGCAFLIQGEFTRKASLGHVDEENGMILV